MSRIYFMIGIPGSGKSTLAREMAEKFGASIICPDEIRAHLTGNESNFSMESEVWTLVHQKVAHAVRTNKPCILDATGAHYYRRYDMVQWMKGLGAYVHGVFVNVTLATALSRIKNRTRNGGRYVPDYVVIRMYESLRDFPPTRFDGFDQVDEVRNES